MAPKRGFERPKGVVWDKQKAFCDYYLDMRSGVKAAIKAGYSKKTAAQISSRLMAYPYIQEYLNAEREKIAKKLDLSKLQVLRELAKIVLADPRQVFDDEGKLISPTELNDTIAGAITSIETSTDKDGVVTTKVKFNPKDTAIRTLAQMNGWMDPSKVEVSTPDGKPFEMKHVVVFKDYSDDEED